MRRYYPSSSALLESEYEFGLYEVYYDFEGKINGWSNDARPIACGELAGLPWIYEKFGEALKKPVLDYETGKELGIIKKEEDNEQESYSISEQTG